MNIHGDILYLERDNDDEELIDILDRNRFAVMARIVDCVDIVYNLDLESIIVLCVPEVGLEATMSSEDFDEKLDLTEAYFAEHEEYDMCQRIVNLRERISHKDI